MKEKTIAAFDFDGTLTDRDTLFPFLAYINGSYATYLKYLKVAPSLLPYFSKQMTRQQVKERILKENIGNYPEAFVRKKGEEFAEKRVSLYLKPRGIEKLKWHLSEGHTTVLISANLKFFLHPWGKRMGFHHIISSDCEVKNNLLTGKLSLNNCWGKEKVLRLQSLLGDKSNYTLYAYGDSRGDHALLSYADFGHYRIF